MPVRLQTVVGNYNIGEIPEMIQFCIENGLDIKLFDISRYDNALAGSGVFAELNYVSLDDISELLSEQYGEPTIKYAVGGYGHAKKVFATPEGTKIEIRGYFKKCALFSSFMRRMPEVHVPGRFMLIVIAADRHVRFCREGGVEQTITTKTEQGEPKSTEQLRADFARAAGIFALAKSVKRQIQPSRRFITVDCHKLKGFLVNEKLVIKAENENPKPACTIYEL